MTDAYSTDGDCAEPPPLPFDSPSFVDRRCVLLGPPPGAWYAWEDVADGGAGDDAIEGGDANDLIQGNEGNDALAGGAGADALSGGPGVDSCDGGPDDRDANQGEIMALDDCEFSVGFP